MRANPLRRILAEGGTIIGSEISGTPAPMIARLYAEAGFGFAFIDQEHTTFSLEQVATIIAHARASGIVPLVRVPQGEYAFVARALDAGAQGIIVPRVNTAAEARAIVSWTRYPPDGIRGFGCTPAQTEGVAVDPAALVAHSNAHTLVVVQIERAEALAHLDELLAVPGIDCACLGYMDLSVDLGIPGQMGHPRMVQAVERLIARCRAHGVAAGIISPDLAAARQWLARGMRFISYSSDARLLAQAARDACAAVQAALPAGTPALAQAHP